jgi:hypothetical protein
VREALDVDGALFVHLEEVVVLAGPQEAHHEAIVCCQIANSLHQGYFILGFALGK